MKTIEINIGRECSPIDINSMTALLSAFTTIRNLQLNNSSEKEYLKINGATIIDVIFNNPATIVKWSDGDKTVVKCQKGDSYNPELGLAMCIIKKCCGNKSNYNNVFKKWLPKESVNI